MHATNEQLYANLTTILTASDNLGPKYSQLDSTEFAHLPNTDLFVIASRPFSNINVLNKEVENATSEKEITFDVPMCWFCSCFDCSQSQPITKFVHQQDPVKMKKIRQTFNGPALISCLLPPVDHLIGKFDHPTLKTGKPEAWKQVCGKVEAWLMVALAPELRANPSSKERREHEARVNLQEKEARKFLLDTLAKFEQPKSYPGGKAELYQRCFSLYIVTADRTVTWICDYTHKEQWSEKSAKVTVPLPPYKVAGQAEWL